MNTYRLTPAAIQGIHEQALQLHYATPNTIRRTGMALYITALITHATKFTDCRPTYLTETDTIRRARGYGLYWYDPFEPTKPYTIVLPTTVHMKLLRLSYDFNIKRRGSLADARVAAVLEAIGLRYLIPDVYPPPMQQEPKLPPVRRRRTSDIDW